MLFVVELQQFFCLDMNVYVMYVWPDSHHIYHDIFFVCQVYLATSPGKCSLISILPSDGGPFLKPTDRARKTKMPCQGWNPMVVATMKGMFFSFR